MQSILKVVKVTPRKCGERFHIFLYVDDFVFKSATYETTE